VIAITDKAIDLDAVLADVGGPGQGGVVLFLGRVREESRGRRVTRLHYEAYGDMALRELAALAAQAQRELGAERVALVHRTGTLEIGDLAVAVAVAAAHRAQAFAACSWLIDTLKERVPIWKKEWYTDGSQWIAEHP